MLNILLTNDDGIASNGIKAIEKAFSPNYNIFVIAPLKERSATSMALGIHDKIRVEKIHDNHYIADGYPVDCVNIGLNGNIFPKIDIVLSGINRGVNLGIDVHYSGTVGATRHAAIHDKIAIAMSSENIDHGYSYETEAKILLNFLNKSLKVLKPSHYYNINIPLKLKDEHVMKAVKLGHRKYVDSYTKTHIIDSIYEYYLGGSQMSYSNIKDTDFYEFYSGYITITPLDLDQTNYLEMSHFPKELCF